MVAMKRVFLAIILLLSGIYAAAAQFNGCPPGFCNSSGGIGNTGGSGGGFSPGGNGGAAPADCAVPDAPDGVVDLSKCSNAYYLAVILF